MTSIQRPSNPLRGKGSTAITVVPGIGNSLYPYRRQLKRDALQFAQAGMSKYMDIQLEWPDSQSSRRDRHRVLGELIPWDESTSKEEDSVSEADGPVNLTVTDPVNMSEYKPDYHLLEEGVYQVVAYGYGEFRAIDEGVVFRVQVLRHKIVRVSHQGCRNYSANLSPIFDSAPSSIPLGPHLGTPPPFDEIGILQLGGTQSLVGVGASAPNGEGFFGWRHGGEP
ncbi:hypothetical protein VTP01DRAFT_7271 [Rhizomucor pusillus]|uniref:uncharacterized protein n=1 Tax=Rhizomucor pusillus TaxID=4840 RepID=UPI00374498E6